MRRVPSEKRNKAGGAVTNSSWFDEAPPPTLTRNGSMIVFVLSFGIYARWAFACG
jgi:phage terminase large subunit-like protein